MSRLSKGQSIFATSGKIGPVIVYDHFGKQCIRMKPTKVKQPMTEKQVAYMNRFRSVSKFTKKIRPITGSVWKASAKNMSGNNLFIQSNIHCFDETGLLNNPEALKMSVGSLALPVNIEVTNNLSLENKLIINWEEDTSNIDTLSNQQMLYVLMGQENVVISKSLQYKRSDGQVSIEIPTHINETFYLYIYFNDVRYGTFSDSVCFKIDL